MRAVRIHAYGGSEVMRLEDVPAPVPGAGDVLVKLSVASVNPIDWKMRHGLMTAPLPRILGRDGAGIEEASGKRLLGVGSPGRDGTHAELTLFSRGLCAEIPDGVSLEDAAAIGIAGVSAWIPLVENAAVAPGQKVLVHAGAGGVGCMAIQIARLRGAEVWTTCSARNADWCRALGAHRTVDYAKEDFSALGQVFDAVLDTLGGAAHRLSAEVLKPGGILVHLNAAAVEPVTRKDVRVMPTEVRATPERLAALLNLLKEKKLGAPVESRFPLQDAAQAYELSRGGHARGKIILTMA